MSDATRKLIDLAGGAIEGHEAVALLEDPEATFVAVEPSTEEVRQLLPILIARQRNSVRRRETIVGMARVIERLEQLPSDSRILGYGVESPTAAGNVYFVEHGHVPLGATIVRIGR